MFTGIVEDIGAIAVVSAGRLTLHTRLTGIATGDSIAVNGICLTVIALAPAGAGHALTFDFSPVTFRHTTLGSATVGTRVNLERALKADGRLGGHFLSGHVACSAAILRVAKDGNARLLTIQAPAAVERYIAAKGSVGIDGVSLTVAEVRPGSFTVAVIPHTCEHTTLHCRKAGDAVNVEPDILATYVERLLIKGSTPSLTEEFLRRNGF